MTRANPGNPDRTNMLTPLRRALAVAPDQPAVVGEVDFTYAEWAARMARLNGLLTELGISPGERVAVCAANSHQYLELYQTVAGTGRILVPLNTRLSVHELHYALGDSGTRVLFTDLDRKHFHGVVERVVSLDGEYEELLAAAGPVDLPDDAAGPDDIAGLFYTGGTTGQAKGVMLTHGNLLANARNFMAMWPFDDRTVWMVVAPLFHAAGTIGVLSVVWQAGRHVVLPRFDPAVVLDCIQTHGVTHTLVVPTMMGAMADLQATEPRDVSRFSHLSFGSSPASPVLLERVRKAFPSSTMLHLYGLTETSPIATALVRDEEVLGTERARSCGTPAVGVELRVSTDDGRLLGTREVGEVQVRGPNVMAGYWNKPAETARVLSDDGWFATGDLAYQDECGYLFHVDRAKDMVVTGGENVYSTEVENALYTHPEVIECAVFGVPDPRWGEAVHARVVLKEGSTLTEQALIEHCKLAIAGYKVPKAVTLTTEPLPKSGAGKILKREIRQPYWTEGSFVAGAQ